MLLCAAIPHVYKGVLCSFKRAFAFIHDQTMIGYGPLCTLYNRPTPVYNVPTPALCRSGYTWPEATIKWNIALGSHLKESSFRSKPSPQPEARPQAHSRAGAGSAGRTSPKEQHRG